MITIEEATPQQRFDLNCWASQARAKSRSALRSLGFALENRNVTGGQRSRLKNAAAAVRKNLDALNAAQDQVLGIANASGDQWLQSAQVCPNRAFPNPDLIAAELSDAQDVDRQDRPLGEPVSITVIVVIAVAVAVTAVSFAMSTKSFKNTILAFQGIGATAQVAETLANAANACVTRAGTLPEASQAEALQVCANLSDKELITSLGEGARKEGGAALTTTIIVVALVAGGAYALYKFK